MAGGRPRKKIEAKSLAVKRGAPPCPVDLSDIAKQKWQELVEALKVADILSSADSDTMARYCEEFSTWKKANDKIKIEGEVVIAPNGWPVQNAYLAIRSKAAIQLNKMSEQLGLDPLSRQRLHMSTETKDSKADKFFKNREG